MQILFPSFGKEVLELLDAHIREFYLVKGNAVFFPHHDLKMVLVEVCGETHQDFSQDSIPTFYIYEDRWRCSKDTVSKRILSKLGVFRRIHARLCEVVSLENCKEYGMAPDIFREKVRKFLQTHHTYGYLKGQKDYLLVHRQDIVAASQFKRTYTPSEVNKEADAYEWTRYASLPDIRIAGGMGKLLKRFLADICSESPIADSNRSIEIMSYSDNEWGDGDVYRKLGFKYAGSLPPVSYHIEPKTLKRINPRQWAALRCKEDYPVIQNRGSRKWIKLYRFLK